MRCAATKVPGLRLAIGFWLATGLGLVVLGASAHAEYYCSVGFEPAAGGRCVATAARDEVPLYLNDAGPIEAPPAIHHRRRHHGLHERY